MTLQGQLAQPQQLSNVGYAPVFEGDFEAGLLGNQFSQTAARISGERAISQIGLLVSNYDRIIQDAATTAEYCGIIANAAPPATIGSPLSVASAVIANAESTEMSWLVERAEELGQYKGEWLLIQEQQLLVHSPDFRAVRAAVREHQINSPFVYYVPTDDESNSVTI